jgi:Domain of unknown function (DUF4291)
MTSTVNTVPYRQIRAHYDNETVTVYQAYSAAIAIPAARAQKLSAAPEFKLGRMTWIKPSWCWMMYVLAGSSHFILLWSLTILISRYRSGYASKDLNQARILAIKMKHEHFLQLLSAASVTTHGKLTDEDKNKSVRVQWDPERSPSLEVLPYRSIQIGISAELSKKWVEDWIVSIEDVTEKAKGLKRLIDEKPDSTLEELLEKGVMPGERIYELPENIREILKMDVPK